MVFVLRDLEMKCPNCGFNNRDDDSFCQSCGADLIASMKPLAPVEEPPERPPPVLEPPRGQTEESTGVRCPKCGKPMEPGFMLVRTEGRPVRWSQGPDNFWGTVGYPIVEGDIWTGKLSMQGFICSSCRVVTLRF